MTAGRHLGASSERVIWARHLGATSGPLRTAAVFCCLSSCIPEFELFDLFTSMQDIYV